MPDSEKKIGTLSSAEINGICIALIGHKNRTGKDLYPAFTRLINEVSRLQQVIQETSDEIQRRAMRYHDHAGVYREPGGARVKEDD